MRPLSYKEWRAEYEAIKQYGIQMGWFKMRDPVSEPMSERDKSEMHSRTHQRIQEKRESQETMQRKLMGG
jgi:hypothetical protein